MLRYMNAIKRVQYFAWGLSLAVVIIAIVAWGTGYSWSVSSTYQLFPLFGLLAFSLMWGHYIMLALRQHLKLSQEVLADYFRLTGLVVLGALLLHPGLLAWQLWNDGLGLPPGSYYSYVSPSLKIAVISGIIGLFIFLAFELHRKYGERPWFRFISYASDIGMILIFIHAIRLGSNLQEGWFRYVWYFYGLTLLVALIYIRLIAPRQQKSIAKTA